MLTNSVFQQQEQKIIQDTQIVFKGIYENVLYKSMLGAPHKHSTKCSPAILWGGFEHWHWAMVRALTKMLKNKDGNIYYLSDL